MTERVLGPTGSRRRHARLLGLAALVGAIFTVFFVAASTATVSPSKFEGNDANFVVNTPGNSDWATVSGLNVGIDDPSGSTDNAFGQGTKEDDPAVTVVSGSIPPQKSDLTRFYEASELVSNHVFIYLAWERTNNLGSANMDFEINQNATTGFSGSTTGKVTLNRTNGDVLVTYDFGGSGTPVLGIMRWLADGAQNPDQVNHPGANTASECFSANKLPCWGNQQTLNGTISEGAVNTAGTVSDPIAPDAPRTIVQNGFGEASIDLTAAGVITGSGGSGGNSCSFGSATTFLKSRSSASFPAEVKDFVAPVSTPLVNNCGAFKIIKKSSKTSTLGLAGATFTVTGANSGAITNPGTGTTTFTTDSNGEICISSLQADTYTVNETGAPSGYAIDDTDSGTAGNQTSKSVSVSGGDTCTSKSVTFTDTPLSKIQVKYFRQGTQTETAASIVCAQGATTVAADSENLTADPAFDDTDESFSNLAPGTYTCTVVVDP
jgi:uncharacterized surface anchored protein